MPTAQVSLMGVLTVQAKYLPYANLAMDLLTGGPALMIQSATGIVAAFLWTYVRRARSYRGGTSLQALVGTYIAPCLETPQLFRALLTGQGGEVRRTSYGTAYPSRTQGGVASSWWPFGPRGATTRGGTSASGRPAARTSARPDRDAVLAATEARLRQQNRNA